MRAVEPAQRSGAVGEELRVVGRNRQRLVVAHKRVGGTIELDQRIAAVAERIEMIGSGGEHALEIVQRLARPAELEQRHAAPVEKRGVVRRKAKTFVVALERPLELLERVKDQAEARKPIGAVEIGLERRLDQRQRCIQAPALVIDEAETMQRVEMIGINMQDRGVKPLRFVELALFVGAQRAPQHARKIWLRALRRPIPHSATPPCVRDESVVSLVLRRGPARTRYCRKQRVPAGRGRRLQRRSPMAW